MLLMLIFIFGAVISSAVAGATDNPIVNEAASKILKANESANESPNESINESPNQSFNQSVSEPFLVKESSNNPEEIPSSDGNGGENVSSDGNGGKNASSDENGEKNTSSDENEGVKAEGGSPINALGLGVLAAVISLLGVYAAKRK
jgi:hypothetical protein